ncbi:hypothetical protein TPAR_00082, partial [Tolypocladium paradoxum]
LALFAPPTSSSSDIRPLQGVWQRTASHTQGQGSCEEGYGRVASDAQPPRLSPVVTAPVATSFYRLTGVATRRKGAFQAFRGGGLYNERRGVDEYSTCIDNGPSRTAQEKGRAGHGPGAGGDGAQAQQRARVYVYTIRHGVAGGDTAAGRRRPAAVCDAAIDSKTQPRRLPAAQLAQRLRVLAGEPPVVAAADGHQAAPVAAPAPQPAARGVGQGAAEPARDRGARRPAGQGRRRVAVGEARDHAGGPERARQEPSAVAVAVAVAVAAA